MHKLSVLNERISSLTLAYEESSQLQEKQQNQLTASVSALNSYQQQLTAMQALCHEAQDNWKKTLLASDFADEASFLKVQMEQSRQNELEHEIQQFYNELSSISGVVREQEQQLADKIPPDLQRLQAQLDKQRVCWEQADAAWRKLQSRCNELAAVRDKLAKAYTIYAELEASYKVYGTLSEVANGRTGNKISLQRFVLSVLLDDVLIEASHRLSLMSKGRYQLVRKEERARGNKASGLELEVEDAYTGKTRSVATLSGGESFMAALSLALGLSDVVQAYAGGIKLDTLFIDEGFGGLDMESLDLAIKALIDLQSSGRMIGIISHVSELKEQMALRLDIISSRQGSSVQLTAS